MPKTGVVSPGEEQLEKNVHRTGSTSLPRQLTAGSHYCGHYGRHAYTGAREAGTVPALTDPSDLSQDTSTISPEVSDLLFVSTHVCFFFFSAD